MKGFTVIDNKTGNYPDCEKIALSEDWAKHLCYCDIDSFAITEDGGLILIDDCGKCAFCPDGRFTVATDNNVGDKVSPNDKDINVPISWISVTERLPEKGGSYLVFSSKSKTVFTAHYWLGDRWANRANGQFITHWMPLPEPPKGEQRND